MINTPTQIGGGFFFSLSSTVSLAHQGRVQGQLKDLKSGVPLGGAIVQILELPQTTMSNEFGVFQFTELPTGTFTIRVSLVGYQREERSFVLAHDEVLQLDFSLAVSEISLDEVVISSSTPQKQSSPKAVLERQRSTHLYRVPLP